AQAERPYAAGLFRRTPTRRRPTMTRRLLLLWIERALIVIGIGLGLWCVKVLLEARYAGTLPRVKVTMRVADEGKTPARAPIETGTVLARLEIPALKISTTVLEGSDDDTLRKGSGHIEETPLPGETGNVGIAGHRDTV